MDDLKLAFDVLANQGMRAIENGRADELEAVLDALHEPISVALDTLQEFNLAFGADSAKDVFPLEWRALEMPFEVHRRLLEQSARSNDVDIVDEIAHWPYRVMELSVERDDHFFFLNAARLHTDFYNLSKTGASAVAGRLLSNRSWRLLKDFGSHQLASPMRDASPEEVYRLSSFAHVLYDNYADLLRQAIDKADATFWDDAGPGFWQVIKVDFVSGHQDPEVELALIETGHSESSKTWAESLVLLSDLQDGLWLCLGSWAAKRWLGGDLAEDTATRILKQVIGRFAGNFKRLWQAYNSVLSASPHEYPLYRWAIFDRPEGVVFMGGGLEPILSRFFVALTLSVATPLSFDQVRSTRNLAQALRTEGLVDDALREVTEDSEAWSRLLGRYDGDQEARLRELTAEAVTDEKRKQWQAIVDQPLSKDKVDAFSGDFLAAWAGSSHLRRLFQNTGSVSYTDDRALVPGLLGFWRLVPKGYFVDETGSTLYSGLGAEFGRAMARAEDDKILKTLRGSTKPRRLGSGSLPRALLKAIEWIESRDHGPSFIISTRGWDMLRRLEGDPDWHPDYSVGGGSQPSGHFRNVPLFALHRPDINELIVVSLPSAGSILQFGEQSASLFYKFDIAAFTPESARDTTEARDWLPPNLRDLPEDRLVEELVSQVGIKIEQAFRIVDQSAGSVVRIDVEPAKILLETPKKKSVPAKILLEAPKKKSVPAKPLREKPKEKIEPAKPLAETPKEKSGPAKPLDEREEDEV